MGALATVFWTAGLSDVWTAKTGGTAGGVSGWATASMTRHQLCAQALFNWGQDPVGNVVGDCFQHRWDEYVL